MLQTVLGTVIGHNLCLRTWGLEPSYLRPISISRSIEAAFRGGTPLSPGAQTAVHVTGSDDRCVGREPQPPKNMFPKTPAKNPGSQDGNVAVQWLSHCRASVRNLGRPSWVLEARELGGKRRRKMPAGLCFDTCNESLLVAF